MSQTVSIKNGHELVTSGPYRYVRHPMYAGGLIACVGSALYAAGLGLFFSSFWMPFSLGAWARKIDSWHSNFQTNTLNTRNGQRH